MPFKKLHSDIKEKLEYLEITTPTPFQKLSIPTIKSGSSAYCFAPKDSGKTTTLILTTLNKLKCESVGSNPRAIILVENKEKAQELYDAFLVYTRHNSLRVYLVESHLHVETQKSEIFEGVDILISTTKELNNLFLFNGLSTAQLQLFSIDDAEFLTHKPSYTALMSMTESIGKCQYVLYAEKMNPMLKRFQSYFMAYSKTVSI
ncbi:DEAD/DEAH box helicase [Flavobacteriaceae bacterium]|nr:DEAD/DEAH box helicase [Flavobacteriaceae bacterium]